MSTSVAQIVSDAISRYPQIGLIDDTTLAKRVTVIERNIYQYIGTIDSADVVVASTGTYAIASDFRADNMVAVRWYNQAEGGSGTPGASYVEEPDIDALRVGFEDSYLKFTARGGNYTKATVFYRPVPADVTADSSAWDLTYIQIDDQYADIITYKLVAELASYGDIPDVSIANNHERLYLDAFAKAKSDFYRRKQRNRTDKIKQKSIW
jgi:hypothetical protein